MKKLLFALLALVLVAGCSSKPTEGTSTPETTAIPEATESTETVTVPAEATSVDCLQNGEGVTTNTIYTVDNGAITKVDQVSNFVAETDEVKSQMEEALTKQKAGFEGVAGITFDYAIEDSAVVVTGSYDITAMDEAALNAIGLTADMKTDAGFMVEPIVQQYSSIGIACEVK